MLPRLPTRTGFARPYPAIPGGLRGCTNSRGLKDDDPGRRGYALIEPANAHAPPELEELDAHLRLPLAGDKLPRSSEIVLTLPRDAAGKIRRDELRDERAAWPPFWGCAARIHQVLPPCWSRGAGSLCNMLEILERGRYL